jgi:hypothetical protein
VDVARLLVGAGAVLDREWLEESGRGESWAASLPGAGEMRRVLGV